MLRVINGARSIDGANNASDIVAAAYNSSPNTTNSTGVDMSDHQELLVNLRTGTLLGTATMIVYVQESNEAAANFTNITGANFNFAATDDNKSIWLSVDWNHPDRKKYARLQGITANNSVEWSASTLRVKPRNFLHSDSGFVLA